MFGVVTSLISIKGIQARTAVPEYSGCLTSSLLITHLTHKICQIYLVVNQLSLNYLLLGMKFLVPLALRKHLSAGSVEERVISHRRLELVKCPTALWADLSDN